MKVLNNFVITAILLYSTTVASAQIFVKDSLQFTSRQDLPDRLTYAAYANDGHNLYAINGIMSGSVYSSEVLKYDPIANQWSVFTDKLLPKIYGAAAYVPQTNKIYVMGGQLRDRLGMYYHVEAIDISTGLVTKLKASNPIPATNSNMAVWNNKIYLFGGSEVAGGVVGNNDLYEFDPVTEKFKHISDMPQSGLMSGAIVNGVLYVFGGIDRHTGTRAKTVYAYDIQAHTWKLVGKLPEYIMANAVVTWQHYIILAGSYPDQNLVAVYNTVTSQFQKLHTNMIGRRYAGAGIINNQLYVFGGTVTNSFPGMASTQVANIQVITEAAQ